MKKFLLFLSVAFGFVLAGNKAYAQRPNLSYAAGSPYTLTIGVPVTITPTNGGGVPTGCTIAPAIPGGLTISATGVISGTPTTAQGTTTYAVTATNGAGSRTTANFTIKIVAAPVFTYASPQTYTVGTAITALAPTGTGTPLTGATIAPAGTWATTGLTLNANGTISGTPTGPIGATVFTVTAVGSNGGTGTATITITINLALPNITYPSPDTYTAGTAIATLNPTNTGGGSVTYTTTGLPAGLTLNAATGAITGTPTTGAGIPAANYSVTATNATGSSTFNINITINPVAAPNIAYTSPDTYTANVAIATLNPTNSGGGLITGYTTTGLPSGLSLNAATGAITGTPTTVAGIAAANYAVTATNATGTSTFNINITINPAAPAITYPTPDTYTANVPIATLSATNTGGPVTTYAVIGTALPAGLALNAATGDITGTPTTVAGIVATNYVIRATNASGVSNFTVNITINPATPAITYPSPQTYTAETAIATLSPTNTGGGGVTYTTTGLPAGLTLNAATGAITGTPTTDAGIAATNYSVTATNVTGASTFNINITINPLPAPNITYPSPDTYTASVAIATLSPTNTGGGGVTYTTTGLPAGLTINAGTGAITGTPTTLAGIPAANYSVTATNTNGTSTFNINITINPAKPIISYATPNTFNVGTAYTLNPTSTGGPVTTYSVAPALPAGLSIDPVTGIISGTPTAATAAANYVVTATNATGNGTFTVRITVVLLAPAITYPTPQTYVVGTAIATLSATNTGGPVTTYTTTGLPAGLTLNAATGDITGTPTTVTAGANYRITAMNASGNNRFNIFITINPQAPNITYPTPDTYTAGTAIATLNPTNTGGAVTTYTTTGLPAGLALNAGTGTITGTPTTNAGIAAANYSVTATNVTGSSTFLINITINPLPPPNITYPSPDTYTANVAIATLNPTNTGGGSVTYTTTGLPAGLAINAGTGAITGTPTTLAGIPAANYSVTATNANGSSTFNINITINVAAPIIAYATPQTYTVGTAIATLNPTNTGGPVTTYAVIGTALPAGLNLNAATGAITGTPTTVSAAANYRVTATNASGASTATIRITVNPQAPSITYPSPDTYTYNTAIATLSPTNTGGAVTTYTTTGLPAGLALNAGTGNITGTPTTAAGIPAANYSVTATNVTGSSTFLINITIVAAPPALTYATPDTYATSTVFTLTPTNAGSPVISSSILPALPAGVTMSATGVISGSSAVAGTASYVVTATNAAGTTSSNSFTITFVSPPIISYSPSTNVYTAGVAIPALTPTNTGGTVGAPGYGTGLSITGAGLNTPQGVTLDASGNIYVADSGNGVIRKYNSAGVYQGTFGTGLTTPMGIVFDSAGNAYVLDARGGRGRVYKFNSAGVLQATLNPVGGNGWDSAFGIAIDASNNLYVSNEFTFFGQGPYVTKFSTAGVTSATITTNLIDPTGIATDASGNLYVLDVFNGALYKYNSSGTFVSTVVSGLNFAEGLTIDSSGNIYIGDSGTNTVTQYSSSGTVLNTITGLTDPEGLAVDAKKDIYVTDATNNTLTEYPLTGGYYLTGTLPAGLSFSTTTGTFSGTPTAAFGPTTFTVTAYNVAGSGSTTVTLSCIVTAPAFHYSPSTNVYSLGVAITPLVPIVTSGNIGAPGFGSPTLFTGTTLNTPQGVATDATGNFYVADSGNGLIRKYNSAGVYQGTFGTIGGGFAGFGTPVGITFDAAGNAYVLDSGNRRVYKFNSAGVYQATLNPAGGNFGTGFGITFNASNGNLYVTNTNGFISEFTTAGVPVATINTAPINTPGSIVTDASGNIYEVDNGTGSVYKFSSTGTYISTIVTGLDNPFGLAIDAQGDLYVGDSADFFTGFAGAIYEYSSSGALITTVTNTVTDPEGITLDSNGDIIVTDATDESVNLYPKNGGYYLSGILPPGLSFSTTTGTFTGTPSTIFGPTTYTITGYSYGQAATTTVTLSCTLTAPAISYTPSTDVYCTGTAITALLPTNTGGPVSAMTFTAGTQITGATLSRPVGIGKDAAGNLFVANSNNATISKYTAAGVYSTTFGSGLTTPMGIVFDSSGNAYVLDQGTGRVYKFNAAGVLQATLNPRGTGGGFVSGTAIAIDASNNMYVTENGNGTIYKFNTGGVLSQTITVAQISAPTGIAIDASGNIYVLDNTNNNIVVLNSAGTYVSTFATGFNGAYGLSIDAAGNIYVGDTGNNEVEVYSAVGTLLTTITTNLNTPEGLITDSSGNLYVTDRGNNTFYRYTVTGNFTITPALPAGLTFNTTTGAITGTPTALSAATVYTVGCSNAAGPATTTVTITVTTTPAFTYTTPDVYPTNSAIASLTPVITAGAGTPSSYSVSPALPTGLSIDPVTGIISGTPTAVTAAANYTVTGTNACGVGTFIINITINPAAPVVAYVTPDVYIDGTAITPLNPNNTGGTATWSISAPLPTGLNFDTTTGIITGTPTVVSPATNYIVTATNVTATVTQTINITCNPALPIISYITPDIYNVGTAITPLTPTNTGGAVASWSISPGLPAGLNFDTTTGIISGTPTVISAAANYVVTATNVTGSATFTINITVTIDAPIIAYTTPDVYTVGSVIPPLVPTNTGGTVATWSISPALPAGLTFDTTTGIITGTPTAASPAANYVVTATNTGGSSMFTINITCVNGGPVLSYITPDVFPVNVAITPLNPVNTGTAPVSYAISPGLPAGLNFDTTTGIISGTPTVTSPATIYTVTATDAGSNMGTTTISIACSGYVDWIGVTSTDWNDPTNWASGAVPTATDIAGIGVNQTFLNFPNLGPSGATTNSVAAVVIGSSSNQVTGGTSATAQAGGMVINAGSILNVSGTITYQSDANAGTLAATLSGAGVINAAGIGVTANTTLGGTYTETLASSVSNLNLSSGIALTSSDNAGTAFNSTFNITGGTVAVAGTVTTTNTAAATSTLSVAGATLQLAGAAPLSGLSATGANAISFNNAGATIEYSGAGQTYYTDANITGLNGGVTYTNIKFSGSGVKSPNGTNANNLKITGDFTNALTTNDAADYIDLGNPQVNFNGTSQNIYGGNGTGTKFYMVTISTAGTATIQSGAVAVASTGMLTMSGASATLAAGGFLTLNSDINGSASVAAIPAGCSVTGNVNVQRFITGGGLNYRDYRLVSSPVYGSTSGSVNIYSINYLLNSVYLKGLGGVPGGFDDLGNPNVYLFRENLAPSNVSFSSGNFRSVNTIGFAPNFNYLIDNDPGTFNIPAGNGYMFFFRGDRHAAPISAEQTVTYIPTNTILTATGTLNQGTITVNDWYTPASANLGWTTTAGNATVQGYNLVGNPYASSIDWDQYVFSAPGSAIYAPNVNPFIYIIDPVSNNYNVYMAGGGGVGTIVSSLSNIIPSGQGFFVRANAATAQLVFNESAKVATQANAANGNLLMGHPVAATAVTQFLHLKILKDTVSADGMIISFRGNTSNTYNANEDALYRNGNGAVSISSMSADNVALAINSMPLPAQTAQTIIPLTVKASTDGTAQIQMAEVKSIPALFTIWLKDAYRKDSLDMRANSTYIFDILHSDTNSYGSHRFSLVMGENPQLMIHLLSFGASKIQTGDQVVWTTENEQNYTNFTVERSTDNGTTFNDLGGFASSGQGTYSYLDKIPVNGANMYRLKIVDLNGTISYSNVVTIMYANTNGLNAINGLMVYPNPTAATIHLSITNNQTSGTTTVPTTNSNYSIEIVNNLGSVIKSSKSNSPSWQSDVSGLTPGTYFIRVIDTSNSKVVGKTAFVKM